MDPRFVARGREHVREWRSERYFAGFVIDPPVGETNLEAFYAADRQGVPTRPACNPARVAVLLDAYPRGFRSSQVIARRL